MEPDDHEHEGYTATVEWDGGTPPTLGVAVTGNVNDGWDVVATIDGFTFTDPSIVEHRPGFGHTHVLVDGRVISMVYEPTLHLPSLDPGIHEITVVLSRNDHLDYALDGELISTTVLLEVEGEVVAPDLVINVTLAGGSVDVRYPGAETAQRGDVVEIVIVSDVADQIHLHGYDIEAEVSPSTPTKVRFVADLPGIYEVEFEGSGQELFDLEVR
jgi:hypothetical protein